jgi:thiol-disulfide isomerase/thioredoxin
MQMHYWGGMYIVTMEIVVRRLMVSCVTILLVLANSAICVAKNVRKLSLRDLNGGRVRMAEYQGRIVVLNFWATWCGPCKEELPRLGEMAQTYASQNVAFLLTSIDEQKKLNTVRDYVSQHKITLPVLAGATVDMLEQLSGTNIVPATLIIDERGEIVRAINGEAREADVKEAVDWLLNGKKGEPPAERVKRY